MLELARLSIVGDVVNNYYTLRRIQQQIVLAKEDVQAMNERLSLIQARTEGGELDYTDVERQQSELSATRANLIDLQQQEGIAMNQLLLLLGEHPGALQQQLAYKPDANQATLPPLSLGAARAGKLKRKREVTLDVLARTDALAQNLGLRGTPGMIVMPVSGATEDNITVIPGGADQVVLQAAIDRASGSAKQ